jgi:quercetin dioxygenase-like cupin family protein
MEALMDRATFEAELKRDGWRIVEGGVGPEEHRPAHCHDFDARFLVIEGAFTLVVDGQRSTYRAGDTCIVPAGTFHEEHTEQDGARIIAGTRQARTTAA